MNTALHSHVSGGSTTWAEPGVSTGISRARQVVVSGTLLLISVTLATHAGAQARRQAESQTELERADELLIVDCLLAPRVKRLGTRGTYLRQGQAIRTTAADCRIRGGEYTEPGQANYATSLAVWRPRAEGGDPEAQFLVGQIYEKGLGTVPDYDAARLWYQKASEQEYHAATVSLAWFYEQGVGVAQDQEQALLLYRRAAGATEDLVVLAGDAYDDLVGAHDELRVRQQEVALLAEQLRELRTQTDALRKDAQAEQTRASSIESLVKRLELELEGKQGELASKARQLEELEKRTIVSVEEVAAGVPTFDPTALEYGRYHALVIGNSAYEHLEDLPASVRDAKRVAQTLQNRYGFETELLLNATRFDVMTALNELREQLHEGDNLLIYYAGHGVRDSEHNTAYWQPVDALPENPTHWIPNGVLADHLDLIPAKHVMVVADSAFTGLRSRSSIARLPVGQSTERRAFWIKQLLERRARLVLTSGNTAPDPESSFADAFISVLQDNQGVLEASRLYRELAGRLSSENSRRRPDFASMRWARGEVTDFFFVANRQE